MVFLVVAGVLLLNVTSNTNITSAQEKASIEQDIFSAKQIIHTVISLPIELSSETIPLSEAINQYYNLELKEDLSSEEKDLRKELYTKIRMQTDILINHYVLIEAQIYRDGISLDEEITLYSLSISNPIRITSEILPSSFTNKANYYINISLYYNEREYAENEK